MEGEPARGKRPAVRQRGLRRDGVAKGEARRLAVRLSIERAQLSNSMTHLLAATGVPATVAGIGDICTASVVDDTAPALLLEAAAAEEDG